MISQGIQLFHDNVILLVSLKILSNNHDLSKSFVVHDLILKFKYDFEGRLFDHNDHTTISSNCGCLQWRHLYLKDSTEKLVAYPDKYNDANFTRNSYEMLFHVQNNNFCLTKYFMLFSPKLQIFSGQALYCKINILFGKVIYIYKLLTNRCQVNQFYLL